MAHLLSCHGANPREPRTLPPPINRSYHVRVQKAVGKLPHLGAQLDQALLPASRGSWLDGRAWFCMITTVWPVVFVSLDELFAPPGGMALRLITALYFALITRRVQTFRVGVDSGMRFTLDLRLTGASDGHAVRITSGSLGHSMIHGHG